VKEPPKVPWDEPQNWAVVDTFGADPTGEQDSSDAIQQAVDSGATTVFFPGAYSMSKPIEIRGKVRRVLGSGNWINYGRGTEPEFRIVEGSAPFVCIEHFAPVDGGIEVVTSRPLILHGTGEVFLEDFVSWDLQIQGQRVWARQLNLENEGTHLTNDGGSLWVLGYKTERGGTLLLTKGGGRSEIFGNFSYTTNAGKLAPMFVNQDSSVFAFFSEICYTGDPFTVLIRETRSGNTREIGRGEGLLQPYIGYPVE
jgi:hypothetical protein